MVRNTAPRGGTRKRTAFPPPARNAAPKTSATRTTRGQRPSGAGRALAGGFGPPAGQGSVWRCGRGDGPCHGSGERAFVGAGGTPKRTAFPRPCGTVPRRPAGPGTAAGQRPTRRAGSARRGRGGRWPGALGPRRARGQSGAVAGAMAPAMAAGLVVRSLSIRPASGGNRKRPAFPRPCGTVPRRSAGPGTAGGQRPTRRARSARLGRGGRWPGALGPRLAWGQRDAVAGAMAPARMRRARAGGRVSRFAVRQPLRLALLRHLPGFRRAGTAINRHNHGAAESVFKPLGAEPGQSSEACCGVRPAICAVQGRSRCPITPECSAYRSPAPFLPLRVRAIGAGDG